MAELPSEMGIRFRKRVLCFTPVFATKQNKGTPKKRHSANIRWRKKNYTFSI
jgi:hypothetical protein